MACAVSGWLNLSMYSPRTSAGKASFTSDHVLSMKSTRLAGVALRLKSLLVGTIVGVAGGNDVHDREPLDGFRVILRR